MINYLFNKFFRNTFYIKFNHDLLSVKHLETGKIHEDKPLMSTKKNRKGKKVIIAIGAEVENNSNPEISLHNGFSHPRVCIGDFEVAQATLMHFISKTINKKRFVRPIIVMHPTKEFDGGLTQIEYTALKELSFSIGARKSYIWSGRELKDVELMSLSFPESEGVLVVG